MESIDIAVFHRHHNKERLYLVIIFALVNNPDIAAPNI